MLREAGSLSSPQVGPQMLYTHTHMHDETVDQIEQVSLRCRPPIVLNGVSRPESIRNETLLKAVLKHLAVLEGYLV